LSFAEDFVPEIMPESEQRARWLFGIRLSTHDGTVW
jgi:hypothetical protein